MDRYKFTKIVKSKDTGNRVYKSTFYPKIRIEKQINLYILLMEID